MNETERIDRFEAAYNRIEQAMKDMLDEAPDRRRHTFTKKVRMIANRHRRFARFTDFLLEVAELRNAIVHNRIGDDRFLAVPLEETVLELERIEQRMFSPPKVTPTFQKDVMTVAPDTTLADMWKMVCGSGHSRFPVYGREGFIGLMTSNGVARFCAFQMKGGKVTIDANSATVADVLEHEHRRDHIAFIERHAIIDEVTELFERTRKLDAVLITEHGRPHEKPLGIICASDIASMSD